MSIDVIAFTSAFVASEGNTRSNLYTVSCFSSLTVIYKQVHDLRATLNSFNTYIPNMQKPVHWCAMQITWLVSI